MDGFAIIDKPAGITSFAVIREARKRLNERKIGHLGTLDPLATGVLVLAVGQATKLVEFFMGADKEYLAEICLGAVSDTYDAEGEITAVSDKVVERPAVERILPTFLGKQSQMPPIYSAIKIQGKKACDIARRGGEPVLKPRKVQIDEIELLAYQWPKLQIRVKCGSGTYIRSLAHDLGQKLGVGAYLTNLRRTRVGRFLLEDAVALPELAAENLLDLEDAVSDWPRWEMPEMVYGRLKSGLSVAAPADLRKKFAGAGGHYPLIAAYCGGSFKGVLEYVNGFEALKFKKQIV